MKNQFNVLTKLVQRSIASLLLLFICGCGTSYQISTEVKEKEHTVPAIQTTDTIYTMIPYDPVDEDSIGRAYLEKYCKGTADIDQDGLKARISFLVQGEGKLKATVIKLTADLEAKERTIKTLDTTKTFTGYTKEQVSAAKLSGGYWGAGITLLCLAGLIGIGFFLKSKFGL